MGINIDQNKMVTIDHSHQEMVDTSIDGNPTFGEIDDLRMQYVFRRKTTKRHDRDGNPLVYALKEIFGYRMQPMHQEMLYSRADEILTTFVHDLNVDALVDVPSSKPLCRFFADRVALMSGLPLIEATFLRKRTVWEVLDEIDGNFPQLRNGREQKLFKSALARLRRAERNIDFQMKEVDKPVRHFFQPFAVGGEVPELEGRRIALIDDLVSSGTSIVSVAKCLREEGATVEHGVVLLSDLNSYHVRHR